MKKLFFIFMVTCAFALIFAEEVAADSAADASSAGGGDKLIEVVADEKHDSDKPWEAFHFIQERRKSQHSDVEYTITVRYTPYSASALFCYACPVELFDRNDAILAIRERILLFKEAENFTIHRYPAPFLTHDSEDGKTVMFYTDVAFEGRVQKVK